MIGGLSPDAIVRRGISHSPEGRKIFANLTVRENLNLYADMHGVSVEERRERYPRLLDMTALGPFTDRLAGRPGAPTWPRR